ncbi:LPPG:FO 2-phospho-L-lactate transferase CofD/UPF0052 [Corchorus olitorius]|uniref:LPPG:FO 2-phospho-L-lactate transferase CofD/UPF0052 n=1 Tax=Corchorus olitorius TaxID=93759 RepID=A0A1R3H4R7_9ROSI|nr:LPPG:FO 2-phospho-L-lactate transferase CofD/UPF0052 [Corchorus olitorius]
MESESKGIAWVGNIYQKFEAMCMEVDDRICEDTFRYVENHLHAVGANVKQFCTELMEDVLSPSLTDSEKELKSSPVQNAGVKAYENSKVNVDEEKELIHSSSVKELKSSPVQNAGVGYENSKVNVDEGKELIHSSAAESIEDVHFGLSSEQSTEDEGSLACSGSIPCESVTLAQVCKNEIPDIESILNDASVETTEDASHKSVTKLELAAVPSFDKVKLEESCIIIDSTELHSLSNEAGERRSYKKKLREAFSSKSRFIKRVCEKHEGLSKEKGNDAGLSSFQTNKSESQDMEFWGTAFNGVVEELKKLTVRVAHVLPVSDDGGSTAEIVRVLGEHSLWEGVSKPYRETIRAFLAYFQNEILRRPNESFCFSNGSIGNFFFAGARIFFQSLDAAIFLFSRVSDIPAESLVLPVISTNDRLTLGCELWDGTIIRGQNEISHPNNGSVGSVDKGRSSVPGLPSRIKRVFYMSSEGRNSLHEVFPTANPAVLDQLSNVDCIVYAMGSLFTSLCPSLVLLGIGEIISSRSCPKVLLLNGTHDRETSGFSASSFVTAITDALNRTYGDSHNCLKNLPSQYINTLLVPKDGEIPVDIQALSSQGIIDVVTVESIHEPKVGIIFDPESLINALGNVVSRYMRTRDYLKR